MKTGWKLLVLSCLLAMNAVVLAQDKAKPKSIFPDRALEAVVRREVFAKRNNNEPLTEDDVKNISTIKGDGKKITDLTGLEKCRSLALLKLSNNAISNLAPIKDLKLLQSVDLANNKIADLKPLENLTGLQYLKLDDNYISNLAPLAKLENLRSLYLEGNEVADLKPLTKLGKLWSLYLKKNKVKDIGAIASLTKLSSLDLSGNEIADLKPLAKMTELRYLILDQNKVSDLGTLVEMAKNDKDKRFAPFWRIYLWANPLSDAAKGAQIQELKKIGARIQLEPAGS